MLFFKNFQKNHDDEQEPDFTDFNRTTTKSLNHFASATKSLNTVIINIPQKCIRKAKVQLRTHIRISKRHLVALKRAGPDDPLWCQISIVIFCLLPETSHPMSTCQYFRYNANRRCQFCQCSAGASHPCRTHYHLCCGRNSSHGCRWCNYCLLNQCLVKTYSSLSRNANWCSL